MSKFTRKLVLWRIALTVIINKLLGYLSRIIPRRKMTLRIEQGIIQGLYFKTCISKIPYVSFLGVPYAKAPIKELRFKPPIKHDGWTGVYKAFTEKSKCPQYDAMVTKTIVGNEDCLHLNIYVPQIDDEKKAIMVFIHGGAFNFGSASEDFYSPDYLLDENTIVVSINYRLNVLGFLNFGIDECPGNMGLKDQLFALKWIKENISAFGGDSENITIFGESAGSASVHYHMMSPLTSGLGLFQKAIMQSGCAFNCWAFNNHHTEAAYKIAENLGCTAKDPHEIVQYLRKVPVSDLVKATTVKFKIEGQRDIINYQFVPSVESYQVSERFLPDNPENLLKTAPSIPLISGINNREGLIIFAEHRLKTLMKFHQLDKISKLLENELNNDEVREKIQNFYFKNHHLKTNNEQLENICTLISDVFFAKDFHRAFSYLLEKNSPQVYNYEFKFDGDINMCKKLLFASRPEIRMLKGACHADELSYLFYGKLFRFSPKSNSEDLSMCKMMSKWWTNFAKTGNPNSADLDIKWINTSLKNPKYLSLNGYNTSMIDGLLNETRVTFWNNLYELSKLNQKL
ncbi:esterase FE4-like [Daktulosphaira vitifoliae]|uniref:esterase FE4-like n=1 Tax=Daktulosphaira vitifoliae TaxID=58002 RepID=UPI0021A9AAA8|nr:esterase FE4-like [Daktulosphaira vitifoliae]